MPPKLRLRDIEFILEILLNYFYENKKLILRQEKESGKKEFTSLITKLKVTIKEYGR